MYARNLHYTSPLSNHLIESGIALHVNALQNNSRKGQVLVCKNQCSVKVSDNSTFLNVFIYLTPGQTPHPKEKYSEAMKSLLLLFFPFEKDIIYCFLPV